MPVRFARPRRRCCTSTATRSAECSRPPRVHCRGYGRSCREPRRRCAGARSYRRRQGCARRGPVPRRGACTGPRRSPRSCSWSCPVLALVRTARDRTHARTPSGMRSCNSPETAAASLGRRQHAAALGRGNRYDYWRVAWHVFRTIRSSASAPATTPGLTSASDHDRRRFRTRTRSSSRRSSELGLVGAGCSPCSSPACCRRRRLRAARGLARRRRTAMVAAIGAFVVWLVDTSGDWMHLLPGVTAIALAAVAVLCCGRRARPRKRSGATAATSRSRTAARRRAAIMAFVLAVAGAEPAAGRTGAGRYLDHARAELTATPPAPITTPTARSGSIRQTSTPTTSRRRDRRASTGPAPLERAARGGPSESERLRDLDAARRSRGPGGERVRSQGSVRPRPRTRSSGSHGVCTRVGSAQRRWWGLADWVV